MGGRSAFLTVNVSRVLIHSHFMLINSNKTKTAASSRFTTYLIQSELMISKLIDIMMRPYVYNFSLYTLNTTWYMSKKKSMKANAYAAHPSISSIPLASPADMPFTPSCRTMVPFRNRCRPTASFQASDSSTTKRYLFPSWSRTVARSTWRPFAFHCPVCPVGDGMLVLRKVCSQRPIRQQSLHELSSSAK